jgi:hypothetical protein
VCSGCLGEVARDEGVELAMGGNNAEDGGRTDVRVSLGAGGALSGLCTGAKGSHGSSSKRLARMAMLCFAGDIEQVLSAPSGGMSLARARSSAWVRLEVKV